jgi:hypothetical protein
MYKKMFVVILLCFLFLFLFLHITNFIENKKNFDKIKYFSEGEGNIENWMSPNLISKNFNIKKKEIDTLFDKELSKKDTRLPLKDICSKSKVDCEDIVKELNSKKIK